MVTRILILLALAAAVEAQTITTFDSLREQPVASQYRAVDIRDTDPIRNPDYRDYNERFQLRSIPTPALIDFYAGIGVQITGTVAQAEADIRRAKRAARRAQRDAQEAAREERQAWKAVAQDWRQTGRDVARELGLPASTGAAWGVEAMYSGIASVTNGATRRDLMLRALAADLAQTRYQLDQQFPASAWWWVEDLGE